MSATNKQEEDSELIHPILSKRPRTQGQNRNVSIKTYNRNYSFGRNMVPPQMGSRGASSVVDVGSAPSQSIIDGRSSTIQPVNSK